MKNISKLFLNGKGLEFIGYFSIMDNFLNIFLTVLVGILFITKYVNQVCYITRTNQTYFIFFSIIFQATWIHDNFSFNKFQFKCYLLHLE